jgi:hypothetical protein
MAISVLQYLVFCLQYDLTSHRYRLFFTRERLSVGKNATCGMLRRVALGRTNVSEEHIAYIIRVERISELRTTLAVTDNPSTLRYCYSQLTLYLGRRFLSR